MNICSLLCFCRCPHVEQRRRMDEDQELDASSQSIEEEEILLATSSNFDSSALFKEFIDYETDVDGDDGVKNPE